MRGGGQLSCSTLTLKSDEARELPLGESEHHLGKNLVESLSTKNRTSTRILESFLKRNVLGFCRRSTLTLKSDEARERSLGESEVAETHHSDTKMQGRTSKGRGKRKIAFTLAEVLITLGIIGIIAVLIIPKQIQKYNEKEKIIKIKKVYSTLSKAMTSIVEEYGTVDTWNLSKSYIPTEDGEETVDDMSMVILVDRLAKYVNHKRLEKNWGDNIVTTNMHNVPISNQIWPNALFLHDGTVLMIGQVYSNESCARSDISTKDLCSSIVVWFPDSTKKRIEGVNQFDFYVMKDRIIPFGMQNDAVNPFNTNCNIKNNVRPSGRGCTAWVIFNENMDYLRCDDLSWDGKKKCK